MKAVLEYIETRRRAFERAPFFRDLVDNTQLSARERLLWAPAMLPFVMGYLDLNQSVFRDEALADDPIQAEINRHTYDEDFHWQWLLDDLETLGLDLSMPMTHTVRFLWSDELPRSRQLPLELAVMTRGASPWGRLVIIEAIESISITIFRHTKEIRLSGGRECLFFGEVHYQAEAGHELNDPEHDARALELTDAQRRLAFELVDRTYALFLAWTEELTRFAESYRGGYDARAHAVVAASAALPRGPRPQAVAS